ncbi:MAG: GNAT family N-acetyltransferase [Pseudomonadota bacterium]
MSVTYRDARAADGDAVSAMARQSFCETFAHLYPAGDLTAFLGDAFGPRGLSAQLSDPDFAVRLAENDGAIVGFAKMGPVTFPGEWRPDAIELYQFYVLKPWQGKGVAQRLMTWVLAHSRSHGAKEILLSVYVDNHRARRFYERLGFVEVGRYAFRVGATIDDDRIMRLLL